jgi:LCP family protein required for cell wall assembly
MGRQGTNVDTLMFVNVNQTSRKVTLVSVPRDLWIRGRKINSVYADYGVHEQVRWVEEVVGFKIHKYALIDLEGFRDVVDLMGGVDVVLEEDLIDPSYRVCDDGICGTLYYEAGPVHLDGTAALRVARSRKTTSDYSRAARQQLIIQGVQDKAKSLDFGDADTLVSILSTIIESTETNISLEEALQYYFRYQSFSLSRGHVISSGNVLVSHKEPVDFVTSLTVQKCLDESRPETCQNSYALYTLIPRDGDFNVIRWYVRSLL